VTVEQIHQSLNVRQEFYRQQQLRGKLSGSGSPCLRHTSSPTNYTFPDPAKPTCAPSRPVHPQANFHLHNILVGHEPRRTTRSPTSIHHNPSKCRPKSPTSSSSSRSAAARMPGVRSTSHPHTIAPIASECITAREHRRAFGGITYKKGCKE